MSAPIPYCSVEYANTFLSVHRWVGNWTAATESERSAALVNASQVIAHFCTFYAEDGETQIWYVPDSETDEKIPDWLRAAACYEALYFLDLENDPARPFPLGILGIIKDDKTTFNHDYEPPLFSKMARRLLEENGAEVFDPYELENDWARRKVLD